MEPQKAKLTNAREQRDAESKRRFRIVMLEQRIAPTLHLNPHGKWVGGKSGG